MMPYYILDDQGEPMPASDAAEWSAWRDSNNGKRRLALDEIHDITVSTVFLGLDHSFGGITPILWETMVFGGWLGGNEYRYTSRADALAGHARVVEKVKAHMRGDSER